MKTADYDYELPAELIAQTPAPEREAARMLVLDRRTGLLQHRGVRDLPEFLNPGDALVINDTRVIPARIFGTKEGSGGRVEVLLLEEEQPGVWLAIYKAAGHAHVGGRFILGRGRIPTRRTSLGNCRHVNKKGDRTSVARKSRRLGLASSSCFQGRTSPRSSTQRM